MIVYVKTLNDTLVDLEHTDYELKRVTSCRKARVSLWDILCFQSSEGWSCSSLTVKHTGGLGVPAHPWSQWSHKSNTSASSSLPQIWKVWRWSKGSAWETHHLHTNGWFKFGVNAWYMLDTLHIATLNQDYESLINRPVYHGPWPKSNKSLIQAFSPPKCCLVEFYELIQSWFLSSPTCIPMYSV